MTDASRAARPWSGNQGRAVVLALGGGSALVGWAWASARDAGSPPDQVSQLVLAIAGCAAVIVGAFCWIGVGRNALRRRTRDVLDRLVVVLPASDPVESLEPSAAADLGESLVALAGSSRYHRADCLLVLGKVVERGSVESGRTPCEMCTP